MKHPLMFTAVMCVTAVFAPAGAQTPSPAEAPPLASITLPPELDRVLRDYEREGEDANGPIYRNNIFEHVIRGGPAGGGYSTVGDLTRFAEALKAGKLVSQASVRTLTTPKPELSSPAYGFGFVIDEGGRIVGHSGGFNGINSQLDIYVGEDYTLAVMSNYGGGAQPIVDKARSLLLAGPPRTAAK